MKRSQVDLAQLKAGMGVKLKRKREPLSPASNSSSKKIAEKSLTEGLFLPPEKESVSAPMKDPTIPSPSVALEGIEKTSRVEGMKTSTLIIPAQPSIPTPHFKVKFTEVDDFCHSMKSALLNLPLEFGSDIVS